jgi:hypothetical protein
MATLCVTLTDDELREAIADKIRAKTGNATLQIDSTDLAMTVAVGVDSETVTDQTVFAAGLARVTYTGTV